MKETNRPFEVFALYEKGRTGSLTTIDEIQYYTIIEGNTTYYFDKSTGLLKYEIAAEEINGEMMEQKKVYGDYQKIEAGILFPMSIEQNAGPQMININIKEVIVNPVFVESDFQ